VKWAEASLVGIALLVAGCGYGGATGDPAALLSQTSKNMGTITSGVLDFELDVDPTGDGEPFGYAITGPFELAGDGGLPRAELDYTQRANGEEATIRLLLDGERGWVESNGKRTELTEAQLAELKGGAALGGEGGLAGLDVRGWVTDPESSDGPDGTDEITGELNVVRAFNDLAGLAVPAGAAFAPVQGADAQRLRAAVKSSSFELRTGEDDRLLRRLAVQFELAPDVPQQLRSALGENVGADFSLGLEIDRPNEPVELKAP
jgi:hypothetical protein